MIDGLEKDIERKGGKILIKSGIKSLDLEGKKLVYEFKGQEILESFDIIINTIPVPELMYFTTGLPENYVENLKKLRYTPVVGLLFGTKKPLDPENYWVNFIGERIHVLYQHSLLVNKYKSHVSWCIRYGGSVEDLPKSDEEIKKLYLDVLKRYFPDMDLNWCHVFREKYAEPVYDKQYAKYAPQYRSPVKHFYNAGIQVTFPKIRNMHVALESGELAAKYVLEDFG